MHDLDKLEELINDILMAARLDLGSGNKQSSEIPLYFEEVNTKAFLEKITASFNNTCTDAEYAYQIVRVGSSLDSKQEQTIRIKVGIQF